MVGMAEKVLLGLFLAAASAVAFENEFDYTTTNETSYKTYQGGIDLGIINPEKYPFTAFQRDEQNIFTDLYYEYVCSNDDMPINYTEWLVMNNFGLLVDTQESLFEKKITTRSTADNKKQFVNTVKKGDILVTGRGIGGLIGHAAIMTTDNFVLEMQGGSGWENGIPDNNRQVPKDKWFDEHAAEWTTVYRCPDSSAASEAATWADRNYFDPVGSATKTIHVKYQLTTNIWSFDPSYCSKLVIQAYYFGTGSKSVIKDLTLIGRLIVPSTIPAYFLSPYQLVNKGRY